MPYTQRGSDTICCGCLNQRFGATTLPLSGMSWNYRYIEINPGKGSLSKPFIPCHNVELALICTY